ncbi:MAG: hypothetical protein FJ344_06510 [Sphingomonadales bacterium]|nr:hypothetical protein [Sphingomonadales bacterium]
MQVHFEVSGDFFLRQSWNPPILSRFIGESQVSLGISGDYFLQTTLSNLADRNQEANRRPRALMRIAK